jgi:hypothetical protein
MTNKDKLISAAMYKLAADTGELAGALVGATTGGALGSYASDKAGEGAARIILNTGADMFREYPNTFDAKNIMAPWDAYQKAHPYSSTAKVQLVRMLMSMAEHPRVMGALGALGLGGVGMWAGGALQRKIKKQPPDLQQWLAQQRETAGVAMGKQDAGEETPGIPPIEY